MRSQGGAMGENISKSSFMARFTPGLLNPDEPTPDIVTSHLGKAANRRFNVYRNNVTASLVNAVAQIYPLTHKALGEDAFRHAALSYVRAYPPASKLLFEYGHGFDGHLNEGGYAGKAHWLLDLARLERAWLEAYHAADANPLAAEALAGLEQDRLAEAVFVPHPAARLVPSSYPIVAIWSALKCGDPDADTGATKPAHSALVTRAALSVEVRPLMPVLAAFFSALISGLSLGEAATTAADHPSGDFDITTAMAAILETGAFAAVSIPD
jgi:Putative DNA-binding domain